MRIYTRGGDLAFKTFTFPDGQPHFKLETYDREFETVTVEVAIVSPLVLFQVALVISTLRQHGYAEINLDIRYLMAARMDRAISPLEPFTLQVVSRFINSLGLSRVRILDAHSEVATRLIRNSENVLPWQAVDQVISALPGTTDFIIPDKGARTRVVEILDECSGASGWTYQCYKERDQATGKLSNFKVPSEGLKTADQLLIIDDICDGGGTFAGLAKELRTHGARKVVLFVTHGIFSKGLPLEGIDKVYCTDSFKQLTDTVPGPNGAYFMQNQDYVTIIPVSMKDMS